ncbi:MAG: O-antigen ligase family protein [Candidatus Sulfotelmatobacter sp.]
MLEAKRPKVFSAGLTSTAGIAYLVVLFSAGLLTNFLPMGTTNTGTVLLYSLACFLSVASVLYWLDPLPKHIANAILATLAFSLLVLVKAVLDNNPVSQRGQEVAIFFLGSWPFLFFLQLHSEKVQQRLRNTLALGLFGLSAFAIFQSIFADSLPLNLFVLRGDNTFSIDAGGAELLRPTGLTGNPIIFSSILVFASALFAALWLEKRKFRFLFALICSLIANYLTYTRASIILVAPVLILVWLFYRRFRIKHKIAILTVGALVIGAGQYLLANGADIVIIQRLQNSDPATIGSTIEHFAQVQNAATIITAHPFAGTGIGSQGDFVGPENVVVTDGAWWILLLELGLPLTILAVVLLCVVMVPLARYVLLPSSKDKALAIATLSFHAYIIPASLVNSALLGHISFGLYWAVLGLSLAGINCDTTQKIKSKSNFFPRLF